MVHCEEAKQKLERLSQILDYTIGNSDLFLAAITHPSAVEGKHVSCCYERLEFLGDSILGAIVANAAFHAYGDLNEGGLTRIKVALVSGSSLSKVAEGLGFADVIIFGQSERGTGRRGLHSALENVYEAIVAALYLDGGLQVAHDFVARTLLINMSADMAKEPENPKSVLQERLQEEGITPTYKLVETQGPPHDRTFVTQVFAGVQALARGVGRTKKESESSAAQSALDQMRSKQTYEEKERAKAQKVYAKTEQAIARAVEKDAQKAEKAKAKAKRARQRAEKKNG